jgi:TraM recognition site of TraD and TraG
MSQVDRDRSVGPGLGANAEIRVAGRIQLGRRLELTQEAAPAMTPMSRFDLGLPDDGFIPAVDLPSLGARPGELPMQPLEWSLAPTDSELHIEDQGLTTSFGIFGAPGSGKTHLLLHLLRQALALNPDSPEQRFGGLILDPKSALIDDVRSIAESAGRRDDLVVINTEELENRNEQVNVIDCGLEEYELGTSLVLAAQSAGVGASEPFWFGSWRNLFGAAVYLLNKFGDPLLGTKQVVTLRQLADSVLTIEPGDAIAAGGRPIQILARRARHQLDELPNVDDREDALRAINQVEAYFQQDSKAVETPLTLASTAYGAFQRSRYRRFSPHQPQHDADRQPTLYDQIIDDGKIVLVSMSPAEAGTAKVLCTLIKVLFQHSVLSRLARVRAGKLRNFTRPLLLACDEYAEVASEVPGEPMGDGHFFSQARQNACMGLIATQSVNVLQASSLKENWRSVFSTLGTKIFLRLADNQTAEEAVKLVGDTDWYLTSLGTSRSKEGFGWSTQRDMRERKGLPSHVLTQTLAQGQAVVHGSLDGRGRSGTWFVQVSGN